MIDFVVEFSSVIEFNVDSFDFAVFRKIIEGKQQVVLPFFNIKIVPS